ncbi:serine hydrolase domain-containing protein [Desertibaculum subflavum]|uniref:serine hydrolase domain-containing protein n=1 Tax=Desertibaculum subflavum TaxID=2268458 RepID=UPI000E66A19E
MNRLDQISLNKRIDALFARWATPGSPGAVVAVAQGGEVLHLAGYGLASIEHGVPIGPRTRFRIASVTKQFVVSAALMLVAEGRLDLGARPSRYLRELPELPVSIDQMMRNCSGLPDFLELCRLGGIGLDHPLRPADIDAVVARSRHLNFEPGSRFLYSNTNFLLLGRIIEQIEDAPLPEVLARRLFRPLGMSATELTPTVDQVVADLAIGYLGDAAQGFRRAMHGFPLAGEGGLVSNIEDLLIWSRHYDRPRLSPADLPKRLADRAPLNGGTANPYARGVEHGTLRGLATLGHGGLWPGYRTEFLRIAETDLTVIVIANLGSLDPYRLARAAAVEALQGDERLAPALPPADKSVVEGIAGTWFNDGELVLFDLAWKDGEPVVTRNGVPFALVPAADGWFAADRGAYEMALRPAGRDQLDIDLGAGRIARCRRVAARTPLPDGLAGTYVSADSGVTWTFAPASGGMRIDIAGPLRAGGPGGMAHGIAGDAIEIEITTSWLPFEAVARLERDRVGKAVALTVSSSRIKNLRFERVAT